MVEGLASKGEQKSKNRKNKRGFWLSFSSMKKAEEGSFFWEETKEKSESLDG